MTEDRQQGLYALHISAHGLIRGVEPELGRDADTGGQVLYVLELARAQARHPAFSRVDLVTRQVFAARVGADYARPEEPLGGCARLVRVPFGPRRYLRKERLWPHLDAMTDSILAHVRAVGRTPDLIHGHYADAGLVGARIAALLNVPFVFTGHSLGRCKRARLLAKGLSEADIEARYNISRRIEAEEVALDHADLVFTSTRQEAEEQYSLYDNAEARRMVVVPPGVNLERFRPAQRGEPAPAIARELGRFLEDPRKPLILAIARPDPRKNLASLVEAYARDEALRAQANLCIIAGCREDVAQLDPGPRKVLSELVARLDRHDLWGYMALPKQHSPADVPALYRLAAQRGGLFVNPALTEPFGLTIIEAAACGLPVVATNDGGPVEVLEKLRNGTLIDPLDLDALSAALREGLSDRRRWQRWSRSGLKRAREVYSWGGHVEASHKAIQRLLKRRSRRRPSREQVTILTRAQRLLICDIDNTLLGDDAALARLCEVLRERRPELAFGVATGRHLASARRAVEESGIPTPDVWITSVGSEIAYGPRAVADEEYARAIAWRWDREAVVAALSGISGLKPQRQAQQGRFKVSFDTDPRRPPNLSQLKRRLRAAGLKANVIASHGQFLDILPARASKGHAVRAVAQRFGFAIEDVFVAGDSGNDLEMLSGRSRGIVVGNHSEELEALRGSEDVHFAEGCYAEGILEGLRAYGVLELAGSS